MKGQGKMIRLTEVSPWMCDMRGMKSGSLTITEPHSKLVYPNGSMATYWKADCECGNTHIVHSAKFNRGDIKSCGCILTRDMMEAKKTLKGTVLTPRELAQSGHKYPYLMDEQIDLLRVTDLSHAVKHEVMYKGKKEYKLIIYWMCHCKCGKDLLRSNRYLLWEKKVKSCGCADPKRKNYRKKILDSMPNDIR